MPIAPIEAGSIQGLVVNPTRTEQASEGVAGGFIRFLEEANDTMRTAETMAQEFADGKHNNIHETILAAERATISFKLVTAVRNRVLAAYTEVMNMRL